MTAQTLATLKARFQEWDRYEYICDLIDTLFAPALADNTAAAWDLQEGTSDYITANTLNDVERVEIGKPLDIEAGIDRSVHFQIWDDFIQQTLTEADTPWILNSGVDAQAVDPAITAAENGVVRLTTGNADGAVANDGSQLVCHIPMQAGSGGLFMEVRLKINTAVTTVSVNVGFTDATGLEEPFTIATGTVTSVASDAACFVYDTAATTDEWFMCAVDGNTDDTGNAALGTAPTADTYQILRIEVSADGATIKFFIDGVLAGTLSGAAGVSPDVNLYATVIANATTTTSRVVDIDYVTVGHTRS